MKIINGDSFEVLKTFEDNSIDSFVTDPPYGISFMGSKWDYDVPSVEFWQEVFRVLKPGGHILVFCGTRTQHRMVVNIEDAGFEIRDVITWLHGQGFPKSLDISKQMDKELGIERKVISTTPTKVGEFAHSGDGREQNIQNYTHKITEPESDKAKEFSGWGTALKPACEFITLARKPISEKTIAKNVLRWRTGGINIDATRIELNGEIVPINKLENWSGFGQLDKPDYIPTTNIKGRWPANLILDEKSAELLDEQSGESKGKFSAPKARKRKRHFESRDNHFETSNAPDNYGDSGGASRFFYVAKPSVKEKGEFNSHPTVKPISLIKYLVNLITPIKGICCDPFLGSGTTALACIETGHNLIGIEREPEYIKIINKRIKELN